MYFVTAALARRRYSSALAAAQLRQAAIALLLELERRMSARQLALEQHHFVVPGHRHEVHVAQAPGVVAPCRLRTDRSSTAPAVSSHVTNPQSRARSRIARLSSARTRDVFRPGSRSATCFCIVPMPVTHRSRALPTRLTRRLASSGGIVRSSPARLARRRATAETCTSTARPGADASALRARACRSAPSRPIGRTPDRAPTAAARGGRSRARSSRRARAGSRPAARSATRPAR